MMTHFQIQRLIDDFSIRHQYKVLFVLFIVVYLMLFVFVMKRRGKYRCYREILSCD